MQRKVKLGIVAALVVVMTASVAYAWVASNTLHFYTTVSTSPFSLTILNDYTSRVVQSPPYLTNPLYYEMPDTLYTNTKNLATTTYTNDVTTNYRIYRTDGLAMDTSWVTVVVYDYNTATTTTLTFTLSTDATISGTTNNVLLAHIGPYTAVGGFSADATVTVTFHSPAPSVEYQADVWVSVS